MGGGKKGKETVKNPSKGSSKLPAKVDLTSKPKNEQAVSTWDTFDSDKVVDESKQKVTNSCVASIEGETSFGPDDLFSPPSKTRKITLSSMKHKVAKKFVISTVSSQDRRAPSSPATASECSNDPTSPNPSPEDDVEEEGDSEGVVETPLTSNRYTLEPYIKPSKDESEGVAPQLDEGGVSGADRPEPDSDPLFQSQGHDEELKCTGVEHLTGGEKKLEDNIYRSAQRSRQDILSKKCLEVKKLQNELKQVKDKLTAEETARKKLETKLVDKDTAHLKDLETQRSEIEKTHNMDREELRSVYRDRDVWEQSMKDARYAFDEQLSIVRLEADGYKEDFQLVRKQLNKTQTELEAAQKEMQAKTAQVKQYKKRNDQQEDKLLKLEERNEQLVHKMERVCQKLVETKMVTETNLQKEQKSMKVEMDRVRRELEKERKKVVHLTKTKRMSKGDIQEEYSLLKAEHETLQEHYENLTKALAQVEEQFSPLKVTHLKLKQDKTRPTSLTSGGGSGSKGAQASPQSTLTATKTDAEKDSVKSFSAKVSHADLEVKNEDLSAQVNEWKSHCYNLQSQLDTVMLQGVGVFLEGDPGENKALIKYLEQQLVLVQKENGKLQDDVKDLEQKMDDVKMERDNLSKQNLELFAVENTYKEKLSEMENIKRQVAVTRETMTSLADQTAAKSTEVSDLKEEKEALQKELDDLRGELESRRLQAGHFEEDFKKERQDRENMAGRIDDERAQQNVKSQKLLENVVSANMQLDRVRKMNTTLEVEKANFEADLTEQEKKISKLQELIRGYTIQLTCHEQSYLKVKDKLEEERQSKEQLENEVAKHQEQINFAAAEKLSLEEQLNVVETNFKLKEKNLEIMAAEKTNINDQIGRMNARYSASQLELTDCRKQLETTIADIYRLSDERRKLDDQVGKTTARYNALQLEFTDCREQLETTIAYTSRLTDEVLAKTQQVRHYKKQVDSYKATLDEMADKLDEMTGRLENTQRELQDRKDCIQRMEEDHQQHTSKSRTDQIQQRLDYELKKTLAQVPKRVRSNLPINLEALAVCPDRPMRFTNPIGKGSYGSVYQVELNGQRCIAKRLHDILIGRPGTEPVGDLEKDRFHEKFVRECILLSQMKHDNIVWFMGVVIDHQNKYNLTLLMEQLSTDLDNYLSNKQNKLPLSTKVSILHDISCGLLHLHQQSIIHRDLSAANVLLLIKNGRPVQAKIADLGMSKFVDGNHPLTEAPGALAYMSPESLLGQHYNDSLDIFSFGVICLFAAIQEFPVISYEHVPDEIHRRGEGELFKRRKLIGMMYSKQPELGSLVLWCLQYDAMKRPSTFCLNISLEEMKKDN